MIQADIIESIKKAQFYFALTDEVTSHNEKHLPPCLHFVDDNCEIQEMFVNYIIIKLQCVRASYITGAIIITI